MPILIVIFIVIGAFLTGNGMMNPQTEPAVTPEEIKAVTEEVKITPSPSPTSTPTLLPSFTPVPKPMATSDPDPYIKCRFKSGVKELRKSQCDSMVDCQVGENWVPSAREDCNKLQQANRNNFPNNQSGTVNCQTQSGWVRMTKDDCTKAQNAWGNQILDNAKQQEQTNQEIINAFRSIENEVWQATNLDQLDNIRERLRQLPQAPDSSIQDYIGTLIRIIEARIKILQQQ